MNPPASSSRKAYVYKNGEKMFHDKGGDVVAGKAKSSRDTAQTVMLSTEVVWVDRLLGKWLVKCRLPEPMVRARY